MLSRLIHRPIAVSMVCVAIAVLGVLALRYIPVSLMPDIAIPKITVQISADGMSAEEVEKTMVYPLRTQLAQVAGLKDIQTESRMDAGTMMLSFEPGADMDILFIEVNEKIDRAMNSMPRSMERPKVLKAGVMDIPAFFIDIKLKGRSSDIKLAQLGQFARNIVAKRIEQIPQTAMVDISGTVKTEILCVPDMMKLQSMNLTTKDIENTITGNNVTLETLSIVNGIYRYTVHFDSQILNKEDIANLYVNHSGRLIQLKEICSVKEVIVERRRYVENNGQDAITLAVIKQADARMDELKDNIGIALEQLANEYPDIDFVVTRDQTRLLSSSINNLEWNLIVGAVLACAILFFFMSNWQLPMLVIISIPMSLIVTVLCFYVCGITLNIISISGLILGVGMIVDNSIIVIDNIIQKRQSGIPLAEAVTIGTKEVFAPMLSSVVTTCSVFLPLMFVSGSAGAMFHDQAIGVSFALFASLFVAVTVIPVFFYKLFSRKSYRSELSIKEIKGMADRWVFRLYNSTMLWVMRHIKTNLCILVGGIVVTAIVYPYIRKEQMPAVTHDDALVYVDWNSEISPHENNRRMAEMMRLVNGSLETSTVMVGTQEFLLSHTREITGNEAVCYIKARSSQSLDSVQMAMRDYIRTRYPDGKIEFKVSGNIYDIIFDTDNPDLIIQLRNEDGARPSLQSGRAYVATLQSAFPKAMIQPISAEPNLRYEADPEKLALYKVSYGQLHQRIKELLGSSKIYNIAQGNENVDVVVGSQLPDAENILQNTVTNSDGVDIPLEYLIDTYQTESYKRLAANAEGEFLPVVIQKVSDKELRNIITMSDTLAANSHLTTSYAGNYFASRQMIMELLVVFVVAVLLLYLILASQFESVVQPVIILSEIIADVAVVLVVLFFLGESLNMMSMIGLIVMSGIIVNDSILKVDTINRLYRAGMPLLRAVLQAGQMRLKPILVTSLTTILALVPFLGRSSLGAAIQYPLTVTLIVGMTVGTLVSLFYVPMLYYLIYRHKR